MSDEAENDRAVVGDNGAISKEAKDRLFSVIQRIETLEEEKKDLAEDIKDVYAEAKGSGFDPAVLKTIVKIRKADKDKLDEKQAILEVYCNALGMKSYLL